MDVSESGGWTDKAMLPATIAGVNSQNNLSAMVSICVIYYGVGEVVVVHQIIDHVA